MPEAAPPVPSGTHSLFLSALTVLGWLLFAVSVGLWVTGRLPTPSALGISSLTASEPSPALPSPSESADTLARLRQRTIDLQAELNVARARVAEAGREPSDAMAKLKSDLAGARSDRERLEASLAVAASERDAIAADLALARDQHRALIESHGGLEAERTSHRQVLTEMNDKVRSLELTLEEERVSREVAGEQWRIEKDRRDATFASLQSRVKECDATIDELRSELKLARAQVQATPSGDSTIALDLKAVVASALKEPGSVENVVSLSIIPRVGTGAHLIAPVARLLSDDAMGVMAGALLGRLRGLTPEHIAAVMEDMRPSADVVDALARSLDATLTEVDPAPWFDCLLEAGAPSRDLAVALMAKRPYSTGAVLQALLLAKPTKSEASRAITALLNSAQWDRLRAVLGTEALSAATRQALLDEAKWLRDGDLALLIPHVLLEPEFAPSRWPAARRFRLIAEMVATEDEPALARVATWLNTTPTKDGVTRCLVALEESHASLAAVARTRPPFGDRLPLDGLQISDPSLLQDLVTSRSVLFVPYVVQALPTMPAVARLDAIAWLFGVGWPRAEEQLGQLVLDVDPMVRAKAFGVLPSESSFHAVARTGLADADRTVARAAALALDRLGGIARAGEVLPLLATSAPDEASALIRAVRRGEDVEALRSGIFDLLASTETPPAVEVLAAQAFEGAQDAILWNAIGHARPAVRAVAVRSLLAGIRGDPNSVVSRLEDLAKDVDPGVRIALARGLTNVPHDIARLILVRLAGDARSDVRAAAAEALGSQGRYHVLPVLRRLLTDANPSVVGNARLSLAAHGVVEDPVALAALLTDEALGPRAIDVLRTALGLPMATTDVLARSLAERQETPR